jgi:hypothetical protein
MSEMRWVAAAASAGLSALTIGIGVAGGAPCVSASAPVLGSPPTGIGLWWEWDDDDDDWGQMVTGECSAGCSITWEDNYLPP